LKTGFLLIDAAVLPSPHSCLPRQACSAQSGLAYLRLCFNPAEKKKNITNAVMQAPALMQARASSLVPFYFCLHPANRICILAKTLPYERKI
jgi:hypothetical protein